VAICSAVAISCGAIIYVVRKKHKESLASEMANGQDSEVHEIRGQETSIKKSAHSPASYYDDEYSLNNDSLNAASKDVDLTEIMDEVLVDTMDYIIAYSKIAAQNAQEHAEERKEFAIQIRKQCIILITWR